MTGSTLNFQITQGIGTLSTRTAQTDASRNASVNLPVNSISTAVQVKVCVAPNNSPCQVFNASVVPVSSLQLPPIAGTLQVVPGGQNLQPVIVRVTDSSSPPNLVLGASVLFIEYVGRVAQNQPIIWAGEAGISQPSMPVILAKSQRTVQSDINGLSSELISTQGISGNVAVVGTATAGISSVQFAAQTLGP